MKITFILPAIGKNPGQKYIKTWKVMEPLPIATMQGLTPPWVETEFFDDRLEVPDYDTQTDLVALSVETYTARRAYKIAAQYRARGVPVVMGGYHPTILPDEVSAHADAIVIGNAEQIWAQLLEDAERGQLKKVYRGPTGYTDTFPDRSIYEGKGYSPLGLVETGRGCAFKCDFCAITSYYKRQYHPRSVERVVADIERSGKKMFFFVDDNFVANQDYTLALCKALTPLKIKWSSQGSLTMARNPELLKWMKKSGGDMVLIGIESLDRETLRDMNKLWCDNLGDRDELIRAIHGEGLHIYSTFLFGNDRDTPDAFDRSVDFALEHGFFFAAFNHVTPFPGTPLYEKLLRQGRLLTEKWWLDPNYRYGGLPFHPKLMSHQEVSERCAEARRKFFSYSNIARRWLKMIERDTSPLMNMIFLSQNWNLQKEVDQRLTLPMGDGLDELPK